MAGKRIRITTTKELNDALGKFLDDIMKVGASSKGDNFDETVRDKLKYHLDGAKYIYTQQWCSREKDSIFLEHYQTTLDNKFDFTNLQPIVDNGRQLDLMIIDKPNGSQKWPDLLVVFKGIGFPIEIKSAKQDIILWNSGIPRADSLYIYNCYGKSKTTCFLGQHAINDEELEFLLLKSKFAEEMNERQKNQKWSYYVRDMFNSSQTFFENDEHQKRCDKYREKIYEYENELKTLVDSGANNKRALTRIDKLNNEINELHLNVVNLDDDYKEQQKSRLHTEKETKDFVKYLTWSSNQKTDFNFNVQIDLTEKNNQTKRLKP
jgi:hypothetical protein